MLNYFNYFTEIEERFSQRKGVIHMLSTLDWALVEMWKDAGVPLEAVLRGVDAAFDHWEKRPARHKLRKINSLAFCAQEVLVAGQEMAAAGVGGSSPVNLERETGFEAGRISDYIEDNGVRLAGATLPKDAKKAQKEAVFALKTLSNQVKNGVLGNEAVERHLTVLEEKLYASVLTATPDGELVELRAEAEREIAPYKRKMQAAQIAQLQQQFIHKRLLEKCGIPRLSLFYLS
ncbi:MAG: hypothetical protein ABI383_08930 [Acidobacteriaceae bacterium]